jgi:hypothetical protein
MFTKNNFAPNNNNVLLVAKIIVNLQFVPFETYDG